MVVEWGTVIAILVPVAGLVTGVFRVLDGRLTRIDRRGRGPPHGPGEVDPRLPPIGFCSF